MALHRILILGSTFFLVALYPNIQAAVTVFVFGGILFTVLWVYEIVKTRDKP